MNTVNIWEEKLKLPSCSTLKESIIKEYSEFFKCNKEDAERSIFRRDYNELALINWKQKNLTPGQEGVIKHYGEDILFIQINLQACYNALLAPHRIFMLQKALETGTENYLDYGGAIGNTAILFSESGIRNVYLADISDKLLDFAQWRFLKRGRLLKTVNLCSEKIPENHFDFITSFATFEYIEKPIDAIENIDRGLRKGGYFGVSVTYTARNETKPWNISLFPWFLFKLRSKGYNLISWEDDGQQIMSLFRKTDKNKIKVKFYMFVDFFNMLRLLARHLSVKYRLIK